MAKWKNKSKKDKIKIKEEYLKFYNNFETNMCPYLNYSERNGGEKAQRLFGNSESDYDCTLCTEFKTLKTKGVGCCPCMVHGSYESKKLLKKLLIHWGLLKSERK